MLRRLGVMQGRLSPPVGGRVQAFPTEGWREEFAAAAGLGLDCLEWVYEHGAGEGNPLDTDEGNAEVRALAARHGVRVGSLVADCFMLSKPFGDDAPRVAAAVALLHSLVDRCASCGIPLIEIPLVDASAIRTESDKRQLRDNLKGPLELARRRGVEISLETSLPPRDFRDLLESFSPAKVWANYDMGNSASWGFDPDEEISTLGELIANVHIKDRVLGGGTVPLGKGNTDFRRVFAALERIGYSGDYILQSARQDLAGGTGKGPVEAVREYLAFVEPYLGARR